MNRESSSEERKKLGQWGEEIASRYLIKRGYKIMARNLAWPGGEVDIVAKDKERIIFVEVKTNRRLYSEEFAPEWRVDWRKRRQIIRTVNLFLDRYFPEEEKEWQIDVISIIPQKEQKRVVIRHFKNVE